MTGRVIAARPWFSLIAVYVLLMRVFRRAADVCVVAAAAVAVTRPGRRP
jgi:hypothetical protein